VFNAHLHQLPLTETGNPVGSRDTENRWHAT